MKESSDINIATSQHDWKISDDVLPNLFLQEITFHFFHVVKQKLPILRLPKALMQFIQQDASNDKLELLCLII